MEKFSRSHVNKSILMIATLFICFILCSFNSQEHKILGDVGISRVIIPAGIRFPANLGFRPQDPDYTSKWNFTKFRLARCQDENYPESSFYANAAANSLNVVENINPERLFSIPMKVGDEVHSFTFGDLVALYGDFRRTVYCDDNAIPCTLAAYTVGPLETRGCENILSPEFDLNTPNYLKSIAYGLWPPYGKAGNAFANSAGPHEIDEAGWWGDEMMRLAKVNDTHFSNTAVAWYVGMHRLALIYVKKAMTEPKYWHDALNYEASALHCLTDLFAYGHVVTSRDQSSYNTILKGGNEREQPYEWMEQVITTGGGFRFKTPVGNQKYKGVVGLTGLPEIEDSKSLSDDYMDSDKVGAWGVWAIKEHSYHDEYNKIGARVSNFNGQNFDITGDARLHELDGNSRRVIEDAITTSVQSLFDAYTLISQSNNPEIIDEIGSERSDYFDALKYIPVYIVADSENGFCSKWTSYSEFISRIINMPFAPIINSTTMIKPLTGGNSESLFKRDSIAFNDPKIKIRTDDACNRLRPELMPIITINDQVWMQKNLDVTTYRDGTPIKQAKSKEDWLDAIAKKEGVWCYSDFDTGTGSEYGKLYNGYALRDPRGLAPIGWHIPSEKEWGSLINYLDPSSKNIGGLLKESGYTHWSKNQTIPNPTNSVGFTALPAGFINGNGDPSSQGLRAIFYQRNGNVWTISNDNNFIYNASGPETDGFSVRCVRD